MHGKNNALSSTFPRLLLQQPASPLIQIRSEAKVLVKGTRKAEDCSDPVWDFHTATGC